MSVMAMLRQLRPLLSLRFDGVGITSDFQATTALKVQHEILLRPSVCGDFPFPHADLYFSI